MNTQKTALLVAVGAAGLLTSGCANMNTGGYLGMVGGAAAGGYAGSEMDDGSGTMTLVGAVIGGSMGMVLGSGAVTPGEMAQAASDAQVIETIAEASSTPAPYSPYVSTSGATPGTPAADTPAGAPASEELAPKSVSFYFTVGIEPRDGNTRNPMCYSNTMNVTIPFNPRGWGNHGRFLEMVQPMMGSFREKCARLGTVVGSVSYGASDNISSGWPRPTPHAEDYTVTMP